MKDQHGDAVQLHTTHSNVHVLAPPEAPERRFYRLKATISA